MEAGGQLGADVVDRRSNIDTDFARGVMMS
jgi:hypothetical protein